MNVPLPAGSVEALSQGACDFYDFLRTTVIIPDKSYSESFIEDLCDCSPCSRQLKSLSLVDIHGMIARWTSTKYHTAPIQEVVRDIQLKCLKKEIGIYTYNSNLNPKKKRAANDIYILLVSKERACFSDINRRITYQFIYETKVVL